MVRVGGGWASLAEFLLKNDPCRGKITTSVLSLHYKLKSNQYSNLFGQQNQIQPIQRAKGDKKQSSLSRD